MCARRRAHLPLGQARRRRQRRLGCRLRERVAPSLPGADWFEVGGGTLDDAIKLAGAMKGGHYDAVVGLGGGKIIDCAKFAAAASASRWSPCPRTSRTTGSARRSPPSTTTRAAAPTVSRTPSPSSSTWTSSATPRCGSCAPASATPSPTSPRSRTGSWPTGSGASGSTACCLRWPARRARPCSGTRAASVTTTSSRCSPRAWS